MRTFEFEKPRVSVCAFVGSGCGTELGGVEICSRCGALCLRDLMCGYALLKGNRIRTHTRALHDQGEVEKAEIKKITLLYINNLADANFQEQPTKRAPSAENRSDDDD